MKYKKQAVGDREQADRAMAGGGGGKLQLLGAWPSPFVMRVRIALSLKGLEYELLEQDIFSKSELLLNSNPVYKKVPVLLHHERPICESLLIVQYIDEVWPSAGPSILPSDPYHRALARFWGAYADDKLLPALKGVAGARGEEEGEAARKELHTVVRPLEELLEKSKEDGGDKARFFGGESIGYVDIALGCFLAWVEVTERMSGGVKLVDEAETPLLAAWAAAFRADEAVKGVMPDVDRLSDFARWRAQKSP